MTGGDPVYASNGDSSVSLDVLIRMMDSLPAFGGVVIGFSLLVPDGMAYMGGVVDAVLGVRLGEIGVRAAGARRLCVRFAAGYGLVDVPPAL